MGHPIAHRNPAVGAKGELKVNLEPGPVDQMPASLSGARSRKRDQRDGRKIIHVNARDRGAADHLAISRIALIVITQIQ
jgi:hypothetical protein